MKLGSSPYGASISFWSNEKETGSKIETTNIVNRDGCDASDSLLMYISLRNPSTPFRPFSTFISCDLIESSCTN